MKEDRDHPVPRIGSERIATDNSLQLRRGPHHHRHFGSHMLGKSRLQQRLHLAFGEIARKQKIAACDVGADVCEAEIDCDSLEIVHDELAAADIHRPKQRRVTGHAASSSRAAWARASSVIEAPERMRAISSRRSSTLYLRTLVRVPSPP